MKLHRLKMNLDKLSMLIKRGQEIIQRDGLIPFIKRVSKWFLYKVVRKVFCYETAYIYEKVLNETSEFEFMPKIQNLTLKIIHTPAEVDALVAKGFDFGSSSIEEIKERLSKGAILFCVFIGREFAHASWVGMNINAVFDSVFQRLNHRDSYYIYSCYTDTTYRGCGIYPHVLSKICKFLRSYIKNTKSKVLINANKKNLSSIRGITKAGFKYYSEACYLKVLWWEFWKEKI